MKSGTVDPRRTVKMIFIGSISIDELKADKARAKHLQSIVYIYLYSVQLYIKLVKIKRNFNQRQKYHSVQTLSTFRPIYEISHVKRRNSTL